MWLILLDPGMRRDDVNRINQSFLNVGPLDPSYDAVNFGRSASSWRNASAGTGLLKK
jgi:hypothetical protein